MADPERGASLGIPGWARPGLLCAIAIIAALLWNSQVNHGSDSDRPDDAENSIAAAERTNSRGGIEPSDGSELSIDRADAGAARSRESEISSLDTDSEIVNPASSGLPWSALGAVDGLLTFRGNPTRTFHGRGLPENPAVEWSVNIGCSNSAVGGEVRQWCGTGWTGQPAVFRSPSDDWWVGVGGYNRQVNFYDPSSGEVVYPGFRTGDIIKGSISVDPDGYPLVYTGSRDNFFHVVSIDRDQPEELWRLSAADEDPTLWNNDWDSSALVVDDHLLVGGENSRFYIVKLNRGYDADGLVTVDPVIVFSTEGWDSELLAALGDRQVSIENSVAVSGDTVYFTNSGGLVQGWNIAGLDLGRTPERVFRYWTGDDTDASIVIDDEGMLYVASEYERRTARSRELGQIFKLDPTEPDDPLVWSQFAEDGINTGVWATPALHRDLVIVPTADGRVLGLAQDSGDVRWTIELPGPLWSSPVVIGDTLVQGDCEGALHGFDVSGESPQPEPLWSLELGGCIESTPAVWDGRIFVGTRAGMFHGIGEADL